MIEVGVSESRTHPVSKVISRWCFGRFQFLRMHQAHAMLNDAGRWTSLSAFVTTYGRLPDAQLSGEVILTPAIACCTHKLGNCFDRHNFKKNL